MKNMGSTCRHSQRTPIVIIFGCLLLITPAAFGLTNGVSFDGVNDYITFGQTTNLGAKTFAIECWFKRTGAGVGVSTGTDGVTAIPLVSKGRGEADGSNKDMNYFLGIRSSDNVLAADFEEGSTGTTPGLNHPVVGKTVLILNKWYHAAASYDGTNFSLYLNGIMETNAVIGQPPRWDSIQHAAVGSSLNSTGAPSGYFQGAIDGVRIWKWARSEEQVRRNMDCESLTTDLLLGQWPLNEGSGATVTNISAAANGTLMNGPAWCAGVPNCKTLGLAAAASPVVTCETPNRGYDFPDVDDADQYHHIDLESSGQTARYRLSTFTIETWFRRDGAGNGADTGASGSGINGAIPLISKGGGGDGSDGTASTDMNYYLGIGRDSADTKWVVVGDFEHAAAHPNNHPLRGTTEIVNGTWYHAAITYGNNVFSLYLNGLLEASVTLPQPAVVPAASSRRAGVATARNSSDTRSANFHGAMDEIRIWQVVRNQAQIQQNMGIELGTVPADLIGYWKLNSNIGNTALDSSANGFHRTIDGSNPGPLAANWIQINRSPAAPIAVSPPSPANGASQIVGPVTLQVQVSDPEQDPLTVGFYGRRRYRCVTDTTPFMIVALPDTQRYVENGVGNPTFGSTPAGFHSQIKWIIDNRVANNIVYVTQLGDCAQNASTAEYDVLTDPAPDDTTVYAFYDFERITSLIPDGLPYGIAVGNHDQSPADDPLNSTATYNTYFGINHFNGYSYWGGSTGDVDGADNNDNHFDLISASGLDFVIIYLEFNPMNTTARTTAANRAIQWADSILKAYPKRRGIIVSHFIMNHGEGAAFGTQGQAVYNTLRLNQNLTLMLCGHVSEEGKRTDFYKGNFVPTMLSDYQGAGGDEPRMGGNGWLRLLKFYPANNQLEVKTYSTLLLKNENDDDSQFTLDYDMQGDFYVELATVTPDVNGNASFVWHGLEPDTEYEWYASVTDNCSVTTVFSDRRTFKTKHNYQIFDLGTIGGQGSAATARGLNNLNQVVGWADYDTGFGDHAFRTDIDVNGNPTAMVDLGAPFGCAEGSLASDINNQGIAVGMASTSGCWPSPSKAFRTSPNSPIAVGDNLGTFGGTWSWATAINSAGDVVGTADSATVRRAFRLPPTGTSIQNHAIDLGTLGGASYGNDINNKGQAVGYAELTVYGTEHPFRTGPYLTIPQTGAAADLGTLSGSQGEAHAINDAGYVVGHTRTGLPGHNGPYHAFLCPPGRGLLPSDDLGTLGGSESFAFDINSVGHIVGYSHIPAGSARAFIKFCDSSTLTDLNTLLPGGTSWILGYAWAINDAGTIVGEGTLGGFPYRAFLMKPAAFP